MSDISVPDAADLAALIGSRICHDLISPLGAIGNGLELLQMAGGSAAGPEMALIGESVASANARIRFFRVAYGRAGPESRMGRNELRGLIGDVTRGGRLRVDWLVAGDVARAEAKLAFLMIQCLEAALPYGGQIAVDRDAQGWQARAEAEKLRYDPELWAWLSGSGTRAEITPAQAQFALAPLVAAAQGHRPTVMANTREIILSW